MSMDCLRTISAFRPLHGPTRDTPDTARNITPGGKLICLLFRATALAIRDAKSR